MSAETPTARTLPFSLAGCVLHKQHRPVPGTSQQHHVYPVGMGGPQNGQRVPMCGSGHLDVHTGIDWLMGPSEAAKPKGIGRAEWEYAKKALAAAGIEAHTPTAEATRREATAISDPD